MNAPNIDVNKADNSGVTPLHWAAFWGRTGRVRALLAVKEIDIHKVTDEGTSLLFYAAFGYYFGSNFGNTYGSLDLVKAVLAAGAVDTPDIHGDTALSYAVEKRQLEMIKLILGTKGAVSAESFFSKFKMHGDDTPKTILMLAEERMYDEEILANEVDKEIYYLIMKEFSFLVPGPCHSTYGFFSSSSQIQGHEALHAIDEKGKEKSLNL